MVFGRVCLANGSIAFMCTVVYPWYALWRMPFIRVDRNAADHRLDIEHCPYLSCLASAYPWTSVGASCGAGVRIRGSVGNYRFAPDHTITAPQAIFCIQGRL